MYNIFKFFFCNKKILVLILLSSVMLALNSPLSDPNALNS